MNIFKRYLLKLKFRKFFGKYLNKEKINEIINNPKNILEEKKEIVECGYIIIDIIQNKHFEKTMTEICNFFSDYRQFFVNIYGTIIEILLFNKSNFEERVEINIDNIINVIKNIPEKNKINIRGIYGITNANVGGYGGKMIFTYMVLLDNYYEKIIKINKLNYGEIMEYNNID